MSIFNPDEHDFELDFAEAAERAARERAKKEATEPRNEAEAQERLQANFAAFERLIGA